MGKVPYSAKAIKAIRTAAGFKSGRGFSRFLNEKGCKISHNELAQIEGGGIDPTLRRLIEIQEILRPAKISWIFGLGESTPVFPVTKGEDLEALRKAKKLSRPDVQGQFGFPLETLSNLETNQTSNGGRVSSWLALAKAYGVAFEFGAEYLNCLNNKNRAGMPRLRRKRED